MEHVVCNIEFSQSLHGERGQSTAASALLSWGSEEDAASFLVSHHLPPGHGSAIVLQETEASLMPPEGPQQSFLYSAPISLRIVLTVCCTLCNFCTFSFPGCVLKSGLGFAFGLFLSLLPETNKVCVALFPLPFCKVHKGPWCSEIDGVLGAATNT